MNVEVFGEAIEVAYAAMGSDALDPIKILGCVIPGDCALGKKGLYLAAGE